jgi:hypothetical protein
MLRDASSDGSGPDGCRQVRKDRRNEKSSRLPGWPCGAHRRAGRAGRCRQTKHLDQRIEHGGPDLPDSGGLQHVRKAAQAGSELPPGARHKEAPRRLRAEGVAGRGDHEGEAGHPSRAGNGAAAKLPMPADRSHDPGARDQTWAQPLRSAVAVRAVEWWPVHSVRHRCIRSLAWPPRRHRDGLQPSGELPGHRLGGLVDQCLEGYARAAELRPGHPARLGRGVADLDRAGRPGLGVARRGQQSEVRRARELCRPDRLGGESAGLAVGRDRGHRTGIPRGLPPRRQGLRRRRQAWSSTSASAAGRGCRERGTGPRP